MVWSTYKLHVEWGLPREIRGQPATKLRPIYYAAILGIYIGSKFFSNTRIRIRLCKYLTKTAYILNACNPTNGTRLVTKTIHHIPQSENVRGIINARLYKLCSVLQSRKTWHCYDPLIGQPFVSGCHAACSSITDRRHRGWNINTLRIPCSVRR